MVDSIGLPALLLFVRLLKLQLGGIDFEGFHALSESWILVVCSGDSDHFGVEVGNKFLDLLSSVPVRVH